FGYDYMLWQIVGLALHLAVAWWLLEVLQTIERGVVATMLALLWASLAIGMEMVVWHHLHGYLVHMLLVLMALHALLPVLDGGALDAGRHVRIFVLLLAACLAYEGGVFLSMATGAALWLARRRGHPTLRERSWWVPASLALPALITLAASVVHFLVTSTHAPEWPGIRARILELPTVWRPVVAAGWWIFAAAVGPSMDIRSGERVHIAGAAALDLGPLAASPGFWLLAAAGTLLALVALWSVDRRSIERLRRRPELPALVLGTLLGYVALVGVGRLVARDASLMLSQHLYYAYMFWAFFAVLVRCVFRFRRLPFAGPLTCRTVAVVLVSGLVLANGWTVQRVNLELADYCRPQSDLALSIASFVERHSTEPDLSFYAPVSYPGNHLSPFLRRPGDPQEKIYSYAEALFLPYFRIDRPKYVLLSGHLELVCRPNWRFVAPRRRR
ncbi:MAG: hypothetical protein HY815_30340, partial [Candidatus Riflebacteria bacterium]|nr:hypothetical protein [Candidatus Riflebacteria bacterium]